MDALRSFIHQAVLENPAANIHKEFVSYYNPVDKLQLLLLGNRKTYSTDKAKIQRLEINKKKEEAAQTKTDARVALPSISAYATAKKLSQGNSSNQIPSKLASQDPANCKSPQSMDDRKRRPRKDVNYNEDSEHSSSSVEYPVEGCHTDNESDS